MRLPAAEIQIQAGARGTAAPRTWLARCQSEYGACGRQLPFELPCERRRGLASGRIGIAIRAWAPLVKRTKVHCPESSSTAATAHCSASRTKGIIRPRQMISTSRIGYRVHRWAERRNRSWSDVPTRAEWMRNIKTMRTFPEMEPRSVVHSWLS